MSSQELLNSLAEDALGRLRWKLCRLFGVAPWSGLGRALGDEACLEWAGHWVLDLQERETGAQAPGNPAFDMERFQVLKGAQK